MVVLQIEDLNWAAVGELPRGGVELPGFIGQLSLEAEEGAFGSLLRLGRDEPIAFEGPPDGSGGGKFVDPSGQVTVDGLGAGVKAGGEELSSQLQDLGLDFSACLVGAGARPSRTRL